VDTGLGGLNVSIGEGGIHFKVAVKPKARRNAIEGIRSGSLVVHITAAPEKGEANKAVVEIIAEWLELPKSSVEITAGHKSRQKWVRVFGLTTNRLEHCLALLGKSRK